MKKTRKYIGGILVVVGLAIIVYDLPRHFVDIDDISSLMIKTEVVLIISVVLIAFGVFLIKKVFSDIFLIKKYRLVFSFLLGSLVAGVTSIFETSWLGYGDFTSYGFPLPNYTFNIMAQNLGLQFSLIAFVINALIWCIPFYIIFSIIARIIREKKSTPIPPTQ